MYEIAAKTDKDLLRMLDLVRTEKVEEMNAASMKDPVDLQPEPITKASYLAPIPYSEILLNPKLAE